MKTCSIRIAAASFCLALAVPAAAQQVPAPGAGVLARPEFKAVTQDFSAGESLELAAHLNMALRRYEQAIPMYEVLVSRSPKRAELWAVLASAYNYMDDARNAFETADIAITLAPHYPHFYAERGIAAFRLDQHPRAIEDLKHYVKAFPANARAYFYLGLAQAAHGDTEAARVNLLRARALNPALTLATSYYLGLIAASRGQMSVSRELLAQTGKAFEGSDLPMARLAAGQLQTVDSAVAGRIRAAIHEADARIAPVPGSPAGR